MPFVRWFGYILLFVLAFPTHSSFTHAKSARELHWKDLQPVAVAEIDKKIKDLNKTFAGFSIDELKVVRQISWQRSTREKMEQGLTTKEDLTTEERTLLTKDFQASHSKVAQLVKRANRLEDRRRALNGTTDDRLDGQFIRLPGYVLPLEFNGTKVTEFLLVPYVGACIHVPPPPPNQIVYVTASEAFESEGLFAPVWVTGTLSTKAANYDLSLVDGRAPISTGYSLDASNVEPYKE